MHLQVGTSGEAVGGSRYRTLGRLGAGGMAEVDLALQTGVAGSSRLCVLKRVRRDLAGRQEFVSMFFEEARISASLSHPNIVQIYEVGGDEKDCFLALEFLRGRSYAHLLQVNAGQKLDYRVDLEVMLATLSGLSHAHQRRDLAGEPMCLVHRDISPPNVFVTYEGEIKVLDFGVAKSKDSRIQTEAGILKGKAAYMAPEVVAGAPLDARADLYAVGVMLWEATAGGDRWPGLNDMAILTQLARGEAVEAPGAAARGLPPEADAICIKALASNPDERYQTATEFRDALLGLCAKLGGRLEQPELRDYMQRHFAADRQREEREVEAALRGERSPPDAQPSDGDVGGFTKRVRHTSEAPPSPLPEQAAPPKRGRGALWAAAGAALLLGAVLTQVVTSPRGAAAGDAAEDAAAKVASASSPATPALPEPAAPKPEAKAEPAPAPAKVETSEKAVKAEPARPGKPSAAPRGQSPAPAPARGKPASAPAAPRSLQLDRQDPWQE